MLGTRRDKLPANELVAARPSAVEQIAALKERIAALELREDQITTALADARMGLWEVSLASRQANASSLTETIPGAEPGKISSTLEEFFLNVHPEDRPIVQDASSSAVRDGAGACFEVEFRSVPEDQGVRWNSARARVYRNPLDGSTQLRGVRMDISDRKSLEAQLRQAQKMEAVGKLAGGVAHDFNNLLTTILGYSNLVLDTMDDGDGRRADIKEVISAANRAVALTAQLLAFSRKQVLQPTAVDLNSLVSELWQMMSRLVGENVQLVPNFANELGAVRADRSQLEQVLMHLVVNARDAMPGGGTITISTADAVLEQSLTQDVMVTPGPYVLLSVTDNGVGMSTEVKDQLFEPFFTTKGQGKGTGLGLATVYGVVKQSGGYVSATSEPGKGSTFSVYLPRASGDAGEEKADGGELNLRGTERILLVEDDNAVRLLTRRMLETAGYKVFEAPDPQEAAVMFEESPDLFDILVTDVIMPGESGPQLHERLSLLRPGLKVVFMSGFTSDFVASKGELDPKLDFLQKPFTADSLTRRVRDVLDG